MIQLLFYQLISEIKSSNWFRDNWHSLLRLFHISKSTFLVWWRTGDKMAKNGFKLKGILVYLSFKKWEFNDFWFLLRSKCALWIPFTNSHATFGGSLSSTVWLGLWHHLCCNDINATTTATIYEKFSKNLWNGRFWNEVTEFSIEFHLSVSALNWYFVFQHLNDWFVLFITKIQYSTHIHNNNHGC